MKIAMVGLRAIGQAGAELSAVDQGASFLDLFSGIEKAVEEISARLAVRGHHVTVFCRNRYNPSGRTEYQGVKLVNLPALYTKHLEAFSHTFLAACRMMGGFDLAHFHATGPALFSFLPRITGSRTVVTVHGLDWKREKWRGMAKLVLRAGAWAAGAFPNRTIAVSRPLRDFYAKTWRRKVEYVPNGVDLATPVEVDRIRRFGVSGKDYILFLGRIVPEKGCHALIEAFRGVNTEQKLLLAGGCSYTSEYLARLKKMAEGDSRIIFTGGLHGRDKEEVLSNASLMVLPSTLEGMPIVMLEAMSYGCPVLCSDIPANLDVADPDPGLPEAENAPYAFRFSTGRVSALKSALAIALHEKEMASRMAERARRYVERFYSWDRVTEQTENIYRAIQ